MDHRIAERLALLEARVMLLEQSLGVAGPAAVAAGQEGPTATPAHVERETVVSVSDLCRHDGEDFVRVAYLWLLRKEADDDGIRHYLYRLSHGVDKKTMIHELAAEPESRAFAIKLIN